MEVSTCHSKLLVSCTAVVALASLHTAVKHLLVLCTAGATLSSLHAAEKAICYRGDKAEATVPLTKEAIRSAQLTYEGSFKDPEVLKHWSGSGNLRSPLSTVVHLSIVVVLPMAG